MNIEIQTIKTVKFSYLLTQVELLAKTEGSSSSLDQGPFTTIKAHALKS